jgi:thioredoxin 1
MEVHSEAEFVQVLSECPLVCADFFATWCDPCKQLAPVLDKLATAVPGVKLVKVDVELLPALAAQYNVTKLPTVLFFAHGAERPDLTVLGASVPGIKRSYKQLLGTDSLLGA